MARNRSLKSPDLTKSVNNSMNISAGDTASLIYLWNPWTIITCVGSCTSPIENLMVVIMLHGACSRLPPLAAFGYVMATHLSLYPAILILPVALLLGYGPDTPPTKVFLQKGPSANKIDISDNGKSTIQKGFGQFSRKPILHFILLVFIWSCYVLLLNSVILNKVGGLQEMFEKTYGFILAVRDLSPKYWCVMVFLCRSLRLLQKLLSYSL
uniref:GPI transamidase subunit PIG-U n=1 Tax=Aegilops tauschii subsp. strangulata TaxID=200361 RepID=A0A453MHQ8_AEGTS